jgi:predicted CoA-substrate-specific enzyme activase
MADSKADNNSSLTSFEGIEIGAVSVKYVSRKNNDTIVKIIRHEGNPKKKVDEIFKQNPLIDHSNIVVTGQAAKVLLDLPYRSETECLEKVLSHYQINPDIILSLGGETFIVYTLKNGRIKNILSSSKCAAGTGEFIVQQLQRMDLTLEEGIEKSCSGKIISLATRCSVHCKSDATHKLNKGECAPSDIARTLITDLAKKVCKMIELAQWPTGEILLAGGVALNEPFIDTLKKQLPDSNIIMLNESSYLEAFGASLFAQENQESARLFSAYSFKETSDLSFERLKPLQDALPLVDYRVKHNEVKKVMPDASYILGVDAGSTTTKAILFNTADNKIGVSCYLRTHGNPVAATQKCIAELMRQVNNVPVKIIQTAVTGSGREMVSVYLDNCPSFNEILAHARAATDEVPEVDTVFEIGGQDSKFISFLKGVPIDYAMNEGCSAGTGSFLEESVSVDMGIPVYEISPRAKESDSPIAFGERCAAFINTDLRNALQQGAKQNDVIAGLVYSIADNYISRIVGVRTVGSHILFQGGVALNKSVALAMAARTKRKIVVPSHPELMGCVGTALMTMDLLKDGFAAEKIYRLEDLASGKMETKNTFRCSSCENQCEIQRISIREKTYPFGGLCSKYEINRHRGNTIKEGTDFVAERTKIMFEEFGPVKIDNPLGTIGLPMALTTFEYFPFYAKFINELGFNVVLSNFSRVGNNLTKAPMCYPCEIVHGAVYDLRSQGVDFIFLPHMLEGEINDGCLHGYVCPTTGLMPSIIAHAFEDTAQKLLSPHIGFSDRLQDVTFQEIENLAHKLKIKKSLAKKAANNAFAHYNKFRQRYLDFGKAMMKKIALEPTVVISGRSYVTCYSETNLALPRKIISRGYHAVPADMLPPLGKSPYPRNVWHFTQQILNAVHYVNKYPNMYICLVSCFSCGPDASIYHIIRQELDGQTFCYLEIDSHTAHAGFETRVGAFLDIIEERRRRGAGDKKNVQKERSATL